MQRHWAVAAFWRQGRFYVTPLLHRKDSPVRTGWTQDRTVKIQAVTTLRGDYDSASKEAEDEAREKITDHVRNQLYIEWDVSRSEVRDLKPRPRRARQRL